MPQMTTPEVKAIWEQYLATKASGTPCPVLYNKLIEAYHGLVRIAAQRMHQKNNQRSVDEFTSAGVDGLMDAIRNFDPNHEKKSKFETYAMPRIKGSMLDELRQTDWVPRLVRSNATKMDRNRQVLESKAGRKLSNSELAEQMGMDEGEFECLVQSSTTTAMHSVNDVPNDKFGDEGSMTIEHIRDDRAVQPIEPMLRREFFHKLMGKNFTPQERKIIWLYYFEDLSMKEISLIVKLSESRVSQMHGDIRHRLQQKAARNPEYFADISALVSGFKETVSAA